MIGSKITDRECTNVKAVEVVIDGESMERIVIDAAKKHLSGRGGGKFDTSDAVVKIEHDKWSGVKVTFFTRVSK